MIQWKPASSLYSSHDVERMQQDAVKRVREMQERSRRALSQQVEYPSFVRPDPVREPEPATASPVQGPGLSVPVLEPVAEEVPPPPSSHTHGPSESSGHTSSPLGGLLGGLSGFLGGDGSGPVSRVMEALNLDNDKLLILMLLLILLNNHADRKLILALCYVLL